MTTKESTKSQPMQALPEALHDMLIGQTRSLIEENISGISEELIAAEDGKLSISLGCKLQMIGSKVVGSTTIAFSRKFKDETEGIVEFTDPNQPALPLS